MTQEQRDAIEQLRDVKAAKRVSAANKLRRKPCPEAGPALWEAFEAELEDDRTWKAKDAQLWSLVHNPHPPALARLLALAGDDLGGSAVNDALGAAAVACGRDEPGTSAVLAALLGDEDEVPSDRLAAVVGGLRVVSDEDALDEAVTDRLRELAAEDPPETIPHGQQRRLRVGQLQSRLHELGLGPEPTVAPTRP
jgi:hypothetical protein